MFQLPEEQMCGFSLITANRSSSLDIVDRLLVLAGRKLDNVDVSRPGYLGNGVTMALFIAAGKKSTGKEAFAR